MLQNMFAAKNFFQSQSTVLNCLSGRMTSKYPSFSVLPPIQRTSSSLQIRSCSSSKMEEQAKKTPEEEAWYDRFIYVRNKLEFCYDMLHGVASDFKKTYSMKEEKLKYPYRWATYRLIHKIEDAGKKLIDENVDSRCQIFYLINQEHKWIIHYHDDKNRYDREKVEGIRYDECWRSLLKSSRHPMAEKLREKLNEAGITPETFSQSIDKIFLQLLMKAYKFDIWTIEVVDFGPADIKKVLNELPINKTEYECIKILFNLEESEKWQIKDSEKV